MKAPSGERKQFEDELYEAVLTLKDKKEVRAFFDDICTPAEIEALSDRWRVARLLSTGLSYRVISAQTGVSVATITRVARCLFNDKGGYKMILERTKK